MSKNITQLNIMMPHGRIPRELLEALYDMSSENDHELACKVAFAAIEYSLTGDTNYADDRDVMAELRPYKRKLEHNLDSYNIECENQKIDKQYELLAKLYWGEHYTQSAIGAKVGVSQQEVSKRLKFIRENYPELYNLYH